MKKEEAEDFNPEERQGPTSEGGSEDEGEESEWTEDEDGISDRRWETMRNWPCDITQEEDDEHRHLFQEHCQESRAALDKRARLRAENERLKKIGQDQDEELARINRRTQFLKRKNAEKAVELAALKAARAKRIRANGPTPG